MVKIESADDIQIDSTRNGATLLLDNAIKGENEVLRLIGTTIDVLNNKKS